VIKGIQEEWRGVEKGMGDEDQRGEAMEGVGEEGKLRLRVIALLSQKFCEKAEGCAVQVECVAAGIRRG
jgi:hypothetical protein